MNLKASGFSRPTNDDGFVAVNGVNMSSITCNTCAKKRKTMKKKNHGFGENCFSLISALKRFGYAYG